MRVSREEFEALVAKALEELPEEFKKALENVAICVEEEPSAEDLREVGIDPEDPERDELLGLYQGIPLRDKSLGETALPDRIVIFRGPILRGCRSRRELLRQVRETVQHELGHYFGLEEEELPF